MYADSFGVGLFVYTADEAASAFRVFEPLLDFFM